MTVSITMSGETGGSQLGEVVDLESISPGSTSSESDLYIRHDAVNNPITDCAFYVVRYSGGDYTGSNPDDDYQEILEWGDDSGPSSNGGGGLYMNQNHSGSFPTADWHPYRSTYGAGPSSSIQLVQDAINDTGVGWTPADGEVPRSGEAHIKVRMDVPVTAGSAGDRFIQLVMAYSYTS